MTTTRKPSLTVRVLTAVAEADVHDAIWWQTTDAGPGRIEFFVNCTELFNLGTVDLVPITGDTVKAFEDALEECSRATGGDATYGPLLFAARVRGERPQGSSYPSDQRLWPLFDACGPERELPMGRLRKLRWDAAALAAQYMGGGLTLADAPVPEHDCAAAVDAMGACVACGNPEPKITAGSSAELADAVPATEQETT